MPIRSNKCWTGTDSVLTPVPLLSGSVSESPSRRAMTCRGRFGAEAMPAVLSGIVMSGIVSVPNRFRRVIACLQGCG